MNIDKPPDIKNFMKTIKVMALVHLNVCFPLLIFAITLVKIKTTRTAPGPHWQITLVQVCTGYCLKCNIMSFLKTLIAMS